MTDKFESEPVDPAAKAKIDKLHDVKPGENHDHQDNDPAVISGTEGRGGDKSKINLSIGMISTILAVIGMIVVLLLFMP